jgi:hypothetical protein
LERLIGCVVAVAEKLIDEDALVASDHVTVTKPSRS